MVILYIPEMVLSLSSHFCGIPAGSDNCCFNHVIGLPEKRGKNPSILITATGIGLPTDGVFEFSISVRRKVALVTYQYI